MMLSIVEASFLRKEKEEKKKRFNGEGERGEGRGERGEGRGERGEGERGEGRGERGEGILLDGINQVFLSVSHLSWLVAIFVSWWSKDSCKW